MDYTFCCTSEVNLDGSDDLFDGPVLNIEEKRKKIKEFNYTYEIM